MKGPEYKEAMLSIYTDINNQYPSSQIKTVTIPQKHKTVTMYSEIILQTFDAFQAQQGNLIKAQHVAKKNTRHGSEQRHGLVNSPSLGHTLSIRSLSSGNSQHDERGLGYSGAAEAGSPS